MLLRFRMGKGVSMQKLVDIILQNSFLQVEKLYGNGRQDKTSKRSLILE